MSRNAPLLTNHHSHGMPAKIGGQLLKVAAKPNHTATPRTIPSGAESPRAASMTIARTMTFSAMPTAHLSKEDGRAAALAISVSGTSV